MYLKIENRVKCNPAIELIITLGASASRGLEEQIGQFGTGFIYSLALFAREGLLEGFKLCLGLDVYTFFVKMTTVVNGSGEYQVMNRIYAQKQGGGTYDLNMDINFGSLKWYDVTMGVREFISNCCDGAMQFDGTYNTVNIDGTIEEEGRFCRAKDGYVRIYFKMTDEITEYMTDIKKYFLCLSEGYDKNQTILINTTGEGACIYRKGVYTGKCGRKSLFNYNFNDIELKEDRVVDLWEATRRAGEAIATCDDPNIVSMFLESKLSKSDAWENKIDNFLLSLDRFYLSADKEESVKKTWTDVVKSTLGTKVICETPTLEKMVTGKGLTPVSANSEFAKLLKGFGAKTSDSVLNHHELHGLELSEANANVIGMLDRLWRFIENADMTVGKSKPSVMLYHQNTIIEGSSEGYYRPGGDVIYVKSDHKDDTGLMLAGILLHEIAHYITGANDCTREFEWFSCKLAAKSFLLTL